MTFRNFWQKPAFLIFILTISISIAAAQKTAAPRQEKLLNGLKVLMWKDSNAAQTTIRLRIHSGSAFDPQNKEGVMKLLAASIFPNASAREFFTEELGGSLDVTTDYDYIQITGSGDGKRVLQMLETIAAAVLNPTVDKETTAKLKTAQTEKVLTMEKDANYVADRAAAQKLFGTFPYGRPAEGTAESLARIDFADLLLAEQRFLTADNATLIVSGNIDYELIYRAARRLFGSWRKSEKLVPPNFTQPAAPDETPRQITGEFADGLQMRYATRGLARGDKDFYAAEILTAVLQNRLRSFAPNNATTDVSVKQSDFLLPGYIIFGFTAPPESKIPTAQLIVPSPEKGADITEVPVESNIVKIISGKDVTAEEFAAAKDEFLKNYIQTEIYERWLDADTYKLSSVKDDANRADNVALADVNRVLKQLRTQPIVSVSVTKKTAEKTEKDSVGNREK